MNEGVAAGGVPAADCKKGDFLQDAQFARPDRSLGSYDLVIAAANGRLYPKASSSDGFLAASPLLATFEPVPVPVRAHDRVDRSVGRETPVLRLPEVLSQKGLTVVPKTALIAIVEDDAGLRGAIDNLVRSFGFQTVNYRSAEDFLYHAGVERVDLVISDVHMPGISGLELQAFMRAASSPTPVIIMSASDDPRLVAQARRDGASDYLFKPFDGDALLLRIQLELARLPGPT